MTNQTFLNSCSSCSGVAGDTLEPTSASFEGSLAELSASNKLKLKFPFFDDITYDRRGSCMLVVDQSGYDEVDVICLLLVV